MTYAYILALDPSGSFNEGKGTTGWCILEEASQTITLTGSIAAKSFPCMEAYWGAHLKLIAEFRKKYGNRLIVIIEDFLLYADKANAQINSRFETPKLIGVIQHYCYSRKIPYVMQRAADVKRRWSDKTLHYKGYLVSEKNRLIVPRTKHRVNRHCKDAIRHAVHFSTFKNKEV